MNRMHDDFRRDMQKDPAQLEREIDSTRADLEATLEELEHRLSPSDLLDQLWSQVRRHGGELGGNLGQTLKDNPVPALLTSVGIAWMMASNGRRHDDYAATSRGASGPRMGERWRGAREAVKRRGESTREGIAEARESIAGARERIAESAQSAGDRARRLSYAARQRARRARSGFGYMLDEQPLLLGALGLAAGAIAGAALPPTEQEDRTLGPARDRAMERAKQAAAESTRRAREKAEQAAEGATSAMRAGDGGPSSETASRSSESGIAVEPGSRTSRPETGPDTGTGY